MSKAVEGRSSVGAVSGWAEGQYGVEGLVTKLKLVVVPKTKGVLKLKI